MINNPLITYYKLLLEAVGCVIDEKGYVFSRSANGEDSPIKVTVKKIEKQLVLPTDELIKDGDWTKIVAFHPACESVFSGQSEVLNTLVKLASIRTYNTMQLAVAAIVTLSTNVALHSKLNLKQMDLLNNIGTINKATEQLIISVIKKNTGISGKYPILSYHLSRGGEINDEVYSRTCAIIPHILKSKTSICGLTSAPDKSKEVVLNLYKHLFPEVMTYGSNSKNTPYLFSFLTCFYHVASHLNKINTILGKYAGGMEEIPINWYDAMKDLTKLSAQYLNRPLSGNTGVSLKLQAKEEGGNESRETLEEVGGSNDSIMSYVSPLDMAMVNKAQAGTIANSNNVSNDTEVTAAGIRRLNKLPDPPQPQPVQTYQPQYQPPPQPVYQQPTTEQLMREALNRNAQMYPPQYQQPQYQSHALGGGYPPPPPPQYQPVYQQQPYYVSPPANSYPPAAYPPQYQQPQYQPGHQPPIYPQRPYS